jgi:WD40 repeat protein
MYFSLVSKTVFYRMHVKGHVSAIKFSPDGLLIAVARDEHNTVVVYTAPAMETAGVHMYEMKRIFSDINSPKDLTWSWDSKLLAVTSGNGTVHVHSVEKFWNFKDTVLTGDSLGIVRSFFLKNSYDFYSVEM